MPEDTTVDQVAPGGIVQLNDMPGGFTDDAFDALFSADGTPSKPAQQVETRTPVSQTPTPQTVAPQAQQTQDTPVVPQADDTFIKGERSVYKTKDAAVEGLNQKDQLIDTLRQRYVLATGVDPISGQPVGTNGVQPQPQVVNYAQNPKQYIEDLYKAAQASPEQYAAVQKKFLLDSLGPSVIAASTDVVRNQAIKTVASEIQDFNTFYGSQGYQKALEVVPELKNAIATAESDTQFSGQLPGLYKAAYLIGKGLSLPQAVAAATQLSQTQTPSRPVPTATPTTPTLTPVTGAAKPSFGTIDGIRAIIAQHEASGAKLDF